MTQVPEGATVRVMDFRGTEPREKYEVQECDEEMEVDNLLWETTEAEGSLGGGQWEEDKLGWDMDVDVGMGDTVDMEGVVAAAAAAADDGAAAAEEEEDDMDVSEVGLLEAVSEVRSHTKTPRRSRGRPAGVKNKSKPKATPPPRSRRVGQKRAIFDSSSSPNKYDLETPIVVRIKSQEKKEVPPSVKKARVHSPKKTEEGAHHLPGTQEEARRVLQNFGVDLQSFYNHLCGESIVSGTQ